MGEAMSADFKKIARTEIEEFKNEYASDFRPDPKALPMKTSPGSENTVGKKGKLGENVKCVVWSPC